MKYNILVYPNVNHVREINEDSTINSGEKLIFSAIISNSDRHDIRESETGEYTDEYIFQTYGDRMKLLYSSFIRSYYAQELSKIITPYSTQERETWYIQTKECEMYMLDDTYATPFIDALAIARGITKEELVTKIGENEAAFKTASAAILGQQQKKLDEIKNITTVAEFVAFKLID